MGERIYEEVAVVIKKKYTVRLLEYKEGGKEFTEINVYSKEAIEKNYELSEYFTFGFTVKGKGEEEKKRLERMNEREFEEFVKNMENFIGKKYHIDPPKEEKKEDIKQKKEEEKLQVVNDIGEIVVPELVDVPEPELDTDL